MVALVKYPKGGEDLFSIILEYKARNYEFRLWEERFKLDIRGKRFNCKSHLAVESIA